MSRCSLQLLALLNLFGCAPAHHGQMDSASDAAGTSAHDHGGPIDCAEAAMAGFDVCGDEHAAFEDALARGTDLSAPVVERILVVPMEVDGGPVFTEARRESLIDSLFEADDSAMRFFADASRGQIDFEYEVLEPLYVSDPPTNPCDTTAWTHAAYYAGVLDPAYNRRVFLIPSSCPGVGGEANWGRIGDSGTNMWLYRHSWAPFIHEFGHNLGFGHAWYGGSEYGDRTTVMGRGATLAAPQLLTYGWIDDAAILTDKGLERRLASLDRYDDDGLKLLRLDSPTVREKEYLVSYRTREGWGVGLSRDLDRTVSVHLVFERNPKSTPELIAVLSEGEEVELGGGLTVAFRRIEGEDAIVEAKGPGLGCSTLGSERAMGWMLTLLSVLIIAARGRHEVEGTCA